MATEDFLLPDVLAEGLDVVFCGSAASHASARRRAYYAGPGNRFWPTLHAVGMTPRLLAPEDYALLPQFGLGLTDLAKRHSGGDAELPPGADDAAALLAKVEYYRPRILAFVGKRPAQACLGRNLAMGLQSANLGETRVFVLPSPSGRARAFWDERPWHELAHFTRHGELSAGPVVSRARNNPE